MTLIKRLALCLGVSLLLISCSGKETTSSDPALAQSETSTITHEADACQKAPDPGPCKAQIEKFYFDPATKKCASFNYGGCQGTVPFDTMATCQSSCEVEKSAAAGCMANGQEYNVGQSWAQSCNTCTCTNTDNGPVAVCTDTPCDPNAPAAAADGMTQGAAPGAGMPDGTPGTGVPGQAPGAGMPSGTPGTPDQAPGAAPAAPAAPATGTPPPAQMGS